MVNKQAGGQRKQQRSPYKRLLRWSFMIAVIFWTLIYQLGLQESGLPEFVYANF